MGPGSCCSTSDHCQRRALSEKREAEGSADGKSTLALGQEMCSKGVGADAIPFQLGIVADPLLETTELQEVADHLTEPRPSEGALYK